MLYDELDLPTLERNAWQRGDHGVAELAGHVMDYDDLQAENERLQGIVDGIEGRIVESVWRTGKKSELKELIEAIRDELREGA